MKTFRWAKILFPSGQTRISFLQIDEDDKGEKAKFLAVVDDVGSGLYHAIAFKEDRSGYVHILEDLELEEAKLQVEKYCMEINVIVEGDEIEDLTE